MQKITNNYFALLIFKIILITYSIILTNLGYCYTLPKNSSIPGGIALIPLTIKDPQTPVVFFNNNRVVTIKNDNNYKQPPYNWVVIVGIPITTKPGLHKIDIYLDPIANSGNFTTILKKNFLVQKKNYPIENLKFNPKLVNPPKQDLIRIAKENELIKGAYRYWSNQIPNLKLYKPINGRISSTFGLKRILNGQPKGYHSGLDLAAPLGTKILSPSNGQVILTGNFFYTGNTVFIDHGQGLITSYAHLDQIKVKTGDLVVQSTLIGTVGATGRVTGPHLHWSVSLNDSRVDPNLFLNML